MSTVSPKRYAEILAAVEPIEVAARGSDNKIPSLWKLVSLSEKVANQVNERRRDGISSDQEDMAILAFLDELVRGLESCHDAETFGPVDSHEGTKPSDITNQHFGREMRRWLPFDQSGTS